MPELPEIAAYLAAFERHILGTTLERIRLRSPSLLRTVDPPISSAQGRAVTGLGRIGKRIVWSLDGDLHLVFHLMVTGRFHRKDAGARLPRKRAHAAFDFPEETFFLTEMSTRKQASLHLVAGVVGLEALDPGGLEPLDATAQAWAARLRRENRTLKRALTDPRILSGIGNAHSDEILHAARLSPAQRTGNLTDAELERLREVTVAQLRGWSHRLLLENADRFPEKLTAFHPEMRVHGRYGEPCPVCGDPVQRIVYASRETNYCATCQTGGRLLADRAFSRLLGDDWPDTLEELAEHQTRRSAPPS